MGFFSNLNWIRNLENFQWLIDSFYNFLYYYKEEKFIKDSPIILPKEFQTLPRNNRLSFVNNLANWLAKEAKINVKEVIVQTYTEKSASELFSQLGIPFSINDIGSVGQFYSVIESGIATIAIEETEFENYSMLLGTLSHELAHVFLHAERPNAEEIWEAKDEEHLTDLVAMMLGYGIYICNSQESFEQYSDGQMTGWKASRRGYLSLEECCLVQGLTDIFFYTKEPEYLNLLKPNPKKFVKDARKYFDLNLDEIENEMFPNKGTD